MNSKFREALPKQKKGKKKMKINKCPKCEQDPVTYAEIISYGWRLKCPDCGLETDCCEARAEAIEKWDELTKGVK